MDDRKTKIAIISHALGGGGAERFAALLSFMLTDSGFEIHNVILNDVTDYEFTGPLLNLGRLCKADGNLKRKFSKGIALRKYLKANAIDVIIDNRPRNNWFRDYFFKKIYGKRKVAYLVQNYNLKNYIPQNKFLAGLLYKDAEKLVCVSKAIEKQLNEKYHFTNTATIYNPVNLNADTILEAAGMPENYILYFGRFDEKAKNFSLMLEAFADSEIYRKGFQLILMGDGPDRNLIEIEIAKRNVGEFVVMIPYQKNPFGIVKKAKYTILTSRFEGFPLSIGESLAMGTPVIAVDCKSGPSEVIVNEKNGLLVENYNPQALSKAMNVLIDDSELYQACKQNAAQSVSHLSLESISRQWQEVLSSFV